MSIADQDIGKSFEKIKEHVISPMINPWRLKFCQVTLLQWLKLECRPDDTVLFADKYSVVIIRKLGRHSSGEEFFIGEERIFGKVISGIRHFTI